MFIYRCHVFPPQGLGCYASSVSHSFSNLWFREILVPYFMGKWQAAKQPSLRCCWCRWSDGWRPSVLHLFTFSRQEMSRDKTSDKKMLYLIIVDSHLTNVKDLVWATGCINLIAYIVCQWLLASPKQDKQETGMQTCIADMHAQAFETLPRVGHVMSSWNLLNRWGLAAFPQTSQTTIASDLCIRWILPYVGVSLRRTSALFCVSLCHVSRHRLQISHGLPGSMTPIWHRLSKLVATFNWLHGSPSAAHITAARCHFLNQLSYFVAPKAVKCIAYSNRRSVSFSECTYLLFFFCL